MSAGKWIGAALGFAAAGPLGALAGFAMGYFFEKGMNTFGEAETDTTHQYRQSTAEADRNSFMFSLLVLTSYIIKADGRVMHSEMNVVRRFLNDNFGPMAVAQGEDILHKLFDKQRELGHRQFTSVIEDSCQQIANYMPYAQRLQLLNYLVVIAQADGQVPDSELTALRHVTLHLGLPMAEVDRMLNLQQGGHSLEAAYKVLGVSPQATNEELKRVYRQLALQNHPDRVAALGEDVRKAAEKRLQEINAAKETIWKARGL